jgi:hypothetical protein
MWRTSYEINLGRWDLLVIIALISLLLSFIVPWALGRWRRTWMVFSRSLSILFLAVLLVKPILLIGRSQPMPPKVVVAVDVSESMGLPSGEKGTKLDHAISAAAKIVQEARGKYEVRLYGFGREAVPVERLEDLKAVSRNMGKESKIGDSLLSIAEREDPAAIVLISDGHNTGGIEPRDAIDLIGCPLIVIPPGPDIPNVSVSCFVQGKGYVGDPMPVMIRVKATGLKGRSNVKVLLEEGGKEVFRTSVELREDMKERNVMARATPGRSGKVVYKAVIIPSVPDPISEDNVSIAECLIEDRRIRVLYIEGKPRWECRFLRRYLEEDPGIRYEFLGAWMDGGRLFQGKRLEDYDLVILGDIGRDLVRDSDIKRIEEYVVSGGGIVFMGGKEGPLSGRYKGTLFSAMLPVESAPEGRPWEEGRFGMMLTEKGRAFLGIEDSDLPDLLGYNPVGALKPGAEPLALGPKGIPIVSFRRYGLGKVSAVACDTTWRWAFLPIDAGGSDEAFRKLWGGIIRLTCRERERVKERPASDLPALSLPTPFQERVTGINEGLLKDLAKLSGGALIGWRDDPSVALGKLLSGKGNLWKAFKRKELVSEWILLIGTVSSLIAGWVLLRRSGL